MEDRTQYRGGGKVQNPTDRHHGRGGPAPHVDREPGFAGGIGHAHRRAHGNYRRTLPAEISLAGPPVARTFTPPVTLGAGPAPTHPRPEIGRASCRERV